MTSLHGNSTGIPMKELRFNTFGFSAVVLVLLVFLIGLPCRKVSGQELPFFADVPTARPVITRLSAVPALGGKKQFHTIRNFKLGGHYEPGGKETYESGGQGGVTLESLGYGPLRTAYIAVGTPKRNQAGKITNAIVINSYYSGDSTNMYFFWHEGQPGTAFSNGSVVGPGRLIDTDTYYVIFLDSLGLWGASKPSDGLGLRFPDYSYADIVQVSYRLLKDKLGVEKIRLATGVSMGGSLCYVWALLHPDFVDGILPIAANSTPDNVARWIFQLMNAGLKSDPVWRQTNGDYYNLPGDQRPVKGLMFGWSILNLTALTFDYRSGQAWEQVKGDVFYWEPENGCGSNLIERAEDFDTNDMIVRNRTCLKYDISDHLHEIKAKTLVLHAYSDQWLIYEKAKETAGKIPGARIVGFESPLAHYSCFRAPHICKKDVTAFFREIGLGPEDKTM